MNSRRLSRLAVAGATLVAGTVFAAPVSASVKYNPVTMIGFVGRSDIRDAFGWTGAVLETRAAGLAFDHEFWTDDTYTVTCGERVFPVVHHRQFGRYQLTGSAARDGYGDALIGFRLTGARSGISGTSVAPAPGQPCPEGDSPGTTIDRADLVSTATGWALTVNSGDVRRELRVKR
ncbi:MAG: hypothetical protein ABW022_02680 [Actinoplanes sp.]